MNKVLISCSLASRIKMDDADFALAMMLQAQENEARVHDDAALAWSQNNGEFLAM